jgi:hypothetical protein
VRYSVYGLSLDAEPPIPGLIPSDDNHPPDVVVRLQAACEGDVSASRTANERVWYQSQWLDGRTGQPGLTIHKSIDDGAYRFDYPDGAQFIVHAAGDRVLGLHPPDLTLTDLTTYLTGPVLGFLLRLKGVVSLHASAIQVGDRAVAFVGDAGAGKSTTAAMFTRLGYKVITEDIAALSSEDGGLSVRSGCTDIALWPDAVALLYGSPRALPRFTGGWDKRRLDLAGAGAFAGGSVPLGAVYMLSNDGGRPTAPCVTAISSGRAMVELLANVYGNRLFHHELRLYELDLVHHVVSTVPVKVANRARGASIGKFCEVVLDDVRTS